jgi:aspartyl-tRNA(Asn)/glutamyl-tRNA(Gln) amidotransferase subunit B
VCSQTFNGLEISQFLEASLPELPDAARERLQSTYGLSAYIANVLTSDPPAIRMLDEAVAEAANQTKRSIKTKVLAENVANLLANELFALVGEHELSKAMEEDGAEASMRFSSVSAEQLGVVSAMLADGEISSTMAKHIIRILYTEEQGRDPREVANERGFKLITNKEAIEQICRTVIQENPIEMEKYRMGGKFARKITKFLLGKAMQEANGNAHPERLNEVMLDILDEIAPGIER